MLDHQVEKLENNMSRIYCRALGKTYRQVGEKEIGNIVGEGPMLEIGVLKQEIEDLKKAINERDKFDMIIAKKLKENDAVLAKFKEALSHLNKKIEMLKNPG